MFNPLMQDLSILKDSDVESRLTDLNNKYNISLRMGNSSVCQQIIVAIEVIRYEMARRQREALQKLSEKQNKDLDGLINIG